MVSNSSGLELIPGIATTTGITFLLDEWMDVLKGLRKLPGEYHIITDDAVPPVVHPPRRAPVALRNHIKEKLDEMIASAVITPGLQCVSSCKTQQVAHMS